jgi:uncharacterized protein (TIGR03435 family)
MTQALFFLLNHLWQSTLMAGLAWLVCRTMLKANSPVVRFNVWLAVTAKFLVPFAVFVDAGHRLYVRPVLTPIQSQQVFDIIRAGGTGVAATPFRMASASRPATDWAGVLPKLALCVWALGSAIVLFHCLAAWWKIRRAARLATPYGDFRGVPVHQSSHMRDSRIEPGVFGFWRQTILIPEGIAATLTPAQFTSVLLHEWNHTRRRDNLAAALQMLTEAIFWFYPVIRIIGRRLADERELACDRAVLDDAAADDVEAYAEGILSVCKFYNPSPLPCVSGVSGISGADLKARIRSILRNERPRPLNPTRRWVLTMSVVTAIAVPVVVGFLTIQAAYAQQGNSFVGLATAADKKFEVATAKLNTSGEDRFQLGPPGRGSIRITNVALRGIIVQSFRTQRNMVFGIPAWAETERYDIVGQGPDPKMTNPEVWEMMRSLLIERFHLKYHVEDREMPVYALTLGPKGHKLVRGEDGQCKQEIKDGKTCGDILIPPFGTAMYNMPIGALITGIGARAGRPIIDKTGLTGRFDAKVVWLPDGVQFAGLDLTNVPAEYRPDDITVFQALEQQSGLKLVPERAPVAVVVIDSVSRPDPN